MFHTLNMINIVPCRPDDCDFTISEIKRQYRDVQLTRFALSCSFHPEGTPARNKIPQLCNAIRSVQAGLADTPEIELGILIQSTQGHGWNGKKPLTLEPWQQCVHPDGSVSPRMCHLDPGFLEYVESAIAEVAKCNVPFMLIDDDFGLRIKECFCDRHIAFYNQYLGKDYTREDYVKLCGCDSDADPDMQNFYRARYESCMNYARIIRGAIDRVNPNIRCGLCTPYAGYGFVDGAAMILAGGTKPFIRINNAIYGTQDVLAFYALFCQTKQVMYEIRNVHELIDEADTFPQNYYSESAVAFHGHLTNAILAGLDGAKLWTSEFEVPEDNHSQRKYESYLLKYSPFYEKLYSIIQGGVQWQGVSGILFHPECCLHPLRVQNPMSDNWHDWIVSVVGPYAFPIRYAQPQDAGVFAMHEGVVKYLTDGQIRNLLSKNILIDSQAAKLLDKRGFASLMGVHADDGDDDFAFTKEFEPSSGTTLGLMWDDMAAKLTPVSQKVEILTEFQSGPARGNGGEFVAPGSTYFENELGGRVVVTGWSSQMPFYKTIRVTRRKFVKHALDKLAGGLLEMSVEGLDQQVMVRHGILPDGAELLVAQNLNPDVPDCFAVRLMRNPTSIRRLLPDGTFADVAFRRSAEELVEVESGLPYANPQVFVFRF